MKDLLETLLVINDAVQEIAFFVETTQNITNLEIFEDEVFDDFQQLFKGNTLTISSFRVCLSKFENPQTIFSEI